MSDHLGLNLKLIVATINVTVTIEESDYGLRRFAGSSTAAIDRILEDDGWKGKREDGRDQGLVIIRELLYDRCQG